MNTPLYIEIIQLISVAFQVGVAIYALWLNKVFGTSRAGWSLFGAFALMAALYLNKAFDLKTAKTNANALRHYVMRTMNFPNTNAGSVTPPAAEFTNNAAANAETNFVAVAGADTNATPKAAAGSKKAPGTKHAENWAMASRKP